MKWKKEIDKYSRIVHSAAVDDFKMNVIEVPASGSIIADLWFGTHLIDVFYYFDTVEDAKRGLVRMVRETCEDVMAALKEER